MVVFDPWVLLTTHTFYPSTYMYIISCLFITRVFLYNSLLFLNLAALRYSSLFLILRELRYFSIFTYLDYCQQADFIYWDIGVATWTSFGMSFRMVSRERTSFRTSRWTSSRTSMRDVTYTRTSSRTPLKGKWSYWTFIRTSLRVSDPIERPIGHPQ